MKFPIELPAGKAFDAVGFGLNAVDHLIVVPEYPAYDSKIRLLEHSQSAGGQTATAMVALRRLGLKTAYAGRFGSDPEGVFGLATLKADDVNVDFADVRTVMSNGGSALMGTGIGRGDNRAMEAAQQAISSPLLDNVSIAGAMGVLVNITGGADLTLGEVHQINEIIHDAVGDDAEIIFGAVHEPAMQGEIRVTVIATGFDKAITGLAPVIEPMVTKGAPVIPLHAQRTPTIQRLNTAPPPRPAASTDIGARRPTPAPTAERVEQDLSDMEIPTFIRRQMD